MLRILQKCFCKIVMVTTFLTYNNLEFNRQGSSKIWDISDNLLNIFYVLGSQDIFFLIIHSFKKIKMSLLKKLKHILKEPN